MDIRTYPPYTRIVREKVTVKRENIGIHYTAFPLSWDGGNTYGTAATADNSATYPLGDFAYSEQNHYTTAGWVRYFRPAYSQLWNGTTLSSTVFADFLKQLDWAYTNGLKIIWCLSAYLKATPLDYQGMDQLSQASEDSLVGFITAICTDATTSSLGYKFVDHPGLGAINVGNETSELTTSDVQTYPIDYFATIHANHCRIVSTIFRNFRTTATLTTAGTYALGARPIKVLPFSSQSTNSLPVITTFVGAEARSQAETLIGTGTVTAGNIIDLTAHGLMPGDWIRLAGPALPVEFGEYDTKSYIVINYGIQGAGTFQLAETATPTVPITGATDFSCDVIKMGATTLPCASTIPVTTPATTTLCTFSQATDYFTLATNTLNSNTTSTTSNPIGTGSKTFTVGASLGLTAGQNIRAFNTGTPANVMDGTVTSYSGTTLVMNATSSGGSGTFTAWTIARDVASGDTVKLRSRVSLLDPSRRYCVITTSFGANAFRVWNVSNALTLTNGTSYRVYKSTPAALYGDDGVGKTSADYIDAMSHNMYTFVTPTANLKTQTNSLSYDKPIGGVGVQYGAYLTHGHYGEYYLSDGYGSSGGVTFDNTTDTITSSMQAATTYDHGLYDGDRVLFTASTALPTNIVAGTIYYVINANRGARTFQISATLGGSVFNFTSNGTGTLRCYKLHSWYGRTYTTPMPLWNTESNVNALATVHWTSLTVQEQKDLFFRYYASTLFNTNDGADGLGVSFYYAADWGNNPVTMPFTIGSGSANFSNDGTGKLRIDNLTSYAGWATYPNVEQFYIKTGANAITGVQAANTTAKYTIVSSPSNTSIVVDFAYTGSPQTVASVQGSLLRTGGVNAEAFNYWSNLLTNTGNPSGQVCTFGYIDYPGATYPGIMLHVEGVGVWYTKSDGTVSQW